MGLVVVCSWLTACTEDSSGIATREFDIEFEVLVDDAPTPGTTFKAYVTKGLTDVELAGGDEIHVVTDKGDDVVMSGEGHLAGFYEAQLPKVNDRTVFTFELRRPGGDSALGTKVTIAEPLRVDMPLTGRTYRADENIELTWTNPAVDDTTLYVYAEPCSGVSIDTSEPAAIADNGALSLRAGDLLIGAPAAGGSCVEVTIERSGYVEGVIDPGLAPESEIGAHRYLTYQITIMP